MAEVHEDSHGGMTHGVNVFSQPPHPDRSPSLFPGVCVGGGAGGRAVLSRNRERQALGSGAPKAKGLA